MEQRVIAVGRLVVAVGLALVVADAALSSQQRPVDGTLVSSAACPAADSSYDDYVDFLARRPKADPKDTAFDPAAFRRNTPKEWYDALAKSRGVRCRKITYASDGLRVTGFIVEPEAPGRYPVVVFNRGGTESFGMIRRGDLVEFAGWALDGYVVVASQYRGNDGGEGREESGGADVNDVVHLATLARSLPTVRPDAMFMLGPSRGGMMTFLAMKHGVRVQAAAVIAGPTDLEDGLARRPEFEEIYKELLPDFTRRRTEHLRSRSALQWPEAISAPVLLLHGGADWRVVPEQSLALATRLQALGKPYELVVYHGDDHPLTANWPDARARVRAWFRRFMPGQ